MVDVVAKFRSESTYSSALEKSSGKGRGFFGGMVRICICTLPQRLGDWETGRLGDWEAGRLKGIEYI